jgi:hypothetical protein
MDCNQNNLIRLLENLQSPNSSARIVAENEFNGFFSVTDRLHGLLLITTDHNIAQHLRKVIKNIPFNVS